MFNMKQIGKNISDLRKKSGMTQMELANKFGISYQAISNWERGISMPDIANLTELAPIFNVTVEELLSDEKSVKIINDINNGKQTDVAISSSEFNQISPLLPPDKNKILIESVDKNSLFSEDEATKARTNLYFDDDDDDINIMAKKACQNGNVAMFSLFVNDINDELADELSEDIVQNNNVALLSLIIKRMSYNSIKKAAEIFYNNGNPAGFSIVKNYLTVDCLKKYRMRSFNDNKVPIFSILKNYKSNNSKNTDINELQDERDELEDKIRELEDEIDIINDEIDEINEAENEMQDFDD